MKILIAVDGSPGALAAVRQAIALAGDGLRCEFLLVNVQEPPSLYEVVVTHDDDRLTDLRRGAGEDLLESAECLLKAAGHDGTSEVLGGEPAAAIADAAEEEGCALIIVGTRGAGSPEGTGPGHVAARLLDLSTVPVLVVPAGEPPSA